MRPVIKVGISGFKKKANSAVRGKVKKSSHFANRLVLVMNSKIASKIFAFSVSLKDEWAYNNRSTKFVTVRSYLIRILSTQAIKISLWVL